MLDAQLQHVTLEIQFNPRPFKSPPATPSISVADPLRDSNPEPSTLEAVIDKARTFILWPLQFLGWGLGSMNPNPRLKEVESVIPGLRERNWDWIRGTSKLLDGEVVYTH